MRQSIALVVGITLLLCVRNSAADPAPCPPSVVIVGEDAPALLEILALRGVISPPLPDCPFTQARVTRTDRGFLIEVKDLYARHSRREVSTLEMAATWIESWTREDLSAPLLTGERREAPVLFQIVQEGGAPAFQNNVEEVPSLELSLLPLPEPPERLQFTLGSELALARGGAVLYGTSMRAGLRWGPLRLFLLARLGQTGTPRPASQSQALRKQGSPRLRLPYQNALNGDAPCDADSNGDGIIDNLDCQPPSNGCVIDTNNDGIIDDLDCQDPGGDPGCGVDSNGDGIIDDPNCQPPDIGCGVDTNNDGIIDNPDCQGPQGGCVNCAGGDVGSAQLGVGVRGGISLPLRVGSLSVAPGVALGLGWAGLSSAVVPRAEASLVLSQPLSTRLALDLRLAFDTAPLSAAQGGQSYLRGAFGLRFAPPGGEE